MLKWITGLLLLAPLLSWAAPTSAYALYNYDSNNFLVTVNSQERHSIASITKMFAAAVILDSGVDLNERVRVQGKSTGRFANGSLVSRMDLLKASLISSDNRAAETLAHSYPGGFKQFIEDTKFWLIKNNFTDTEIVDSTGLLAGNVSSINDLVLLLNIVKDKSVIRDIAGEKTAKAYTTKGKREVAVDLKNTNPDIFQYNNILISKTGFTSAAGRCVLMLVEQGRTLYAVVVLGQKNPKERSRVVNNLISTEQ